MFNFETKFPIEIELHLKIRNFYNWITSIIKNPLGNFFFNQKVLICYFLEFKGNI